MTEFASLRDALDALRAAQRDYADTVTRFVTSAQGDSLEQWDTIAEVRDEINAVANRLESLTQAAATRADLDDLRLEVLDRTATPFDPPREAA